MYVIAIFSNFQAANEQISSLFNSFIENNIQFPLRCSNCVESMNDFCYLCYQREKRNVPIYFTDERQQEEQEEDHLLQMFTLLKDKEALQHEEVCNSFVKGETVFP